MRIFRASFEMISLVQKIFRKIEMNQKRFILVRKLDNMKRSKQKK